MWLPEWAWVQLSEIQVCQNGPRLLIKNRPKGYNKDHCNYNVILQRKHLSEEMINLFIDDLLFLLLWQILE